MLKIFLSSIKRHKIISAIILIAIFGIGYYAYTKSNNSSGETRYVLAAVEKGTLIVSVSGSGQVSASDQADIKPKASGDITALFLKKDQEVKKGQMLAALNSAEARRQVADAQIALESAKINLDKVLADADAQSLLAAENAVAQAERDLEKAKISNENISTDTEKTLTTAYENGYNDVSSAFFKLSDYIKDMKNVLGTEKSEHEYIEAYKLILGSDSILIQRLLDDYDKANNFYNESFAFFRQVLRSDQRDTIYKLLNDTLKTTEAISQALESNRHMFDAIMVTSYKGFNAAPQIDKMQPVIESDLSAVSSVINSLQQTIDTIDDTVQNTPENVKDAKLTVKLAEEKLAEKKLALKETITGADAIDIKTQQNIVAQKEASLSTAKENLANYFIYAPFSGVAANVEVKNGDSVSINTAIATLITKQRVAEISLNEVDAAKVKVGQKATFAFDAIENLTISGEILEIDTLGTVTQGVVSYNVKIGFDTEDERVKPGMSVSAAIVTEIRQNVLSVPNSAVKTTDGVTYVQILDQPTQNSAQSAAARQSASISQGITSLIPPQQQQVEIGISNDTTTEIISGLKEGDQIVVRITSPATQTSTQTAPSLFGGGGVRMR